MAIVAQGSDLLFLFGGLFGVFSPFNNNFLVYSSLKMWRLTAKTIEWLVIYDELYNAKIYITLNIVFHGIKIIEWSIVILNKR